MHFHLDFYANHKQVYDKINEIEQHTLCVTNQPEIFESCIDLYEPTKYVQFALGFHPHNAGKEYFRKGVFLNNIKRTKYVGEVGLDFSKQYVAHSKKQIEIFDFICENSYDKIISIHCRLAEDKIYEIVKKHENSKAIIHWYSGNEEWLEKLIDIGMYFSVNSNMMNTTRGKLLIKKIPKNKIFIESDGPFTKIQGKRFAVEKLLLVYEDLSGILELESVDKLKQQISQNFMSLLNLI